jgi:hypothetical protein
VDFPLQTVVWVGRYFISLVASLCGIYGRERERARGRAREGARLVDIV